MEPTQEPTQEPAQHRQFICRASEHQHRIFHGFRARLSHALGFPASLPQTFGILLTIALRTEPDDMSKPTDEHSDNLRQLLVRLPEGSHRDLATVRDRLSTAFGAELSLSQTAALLFRLGERLSTAEAIVRAVLDSLRSAKPAPTRKPKT